MPSTTVASPLAHAPADVRMPAEFEPHLATWMAWPTRREIWGERFEAVKSDYAALARVIARYEPVRMVANEDDLAQAAAQCGPAVEVVSMPIDDSWTRDSGPVFVSGADGRRAAVAFRFTAWGHKYQPFDRDAGLAARIAAHVGVPHVDSPLAAEGGAILSDGEGTLVTTETCLLNRNRNPGTTKAEVEAELRRVLGARKVIWLPGDPTEVETDGHLDGLAAFTAPGRLLVETVSDPADPRFGILRENWRALELATDARGRHFELQPIEEADRSVEIGSRYCRSYVNFYVVNGAVIAPRYGLAADVRVAATLRAAFPGREVVMQPIGSIATGGGGFHCITQQEPR